MKCVVITYTGVHHIVEEDQAIKIANLPVDGEASLNGNLLKQKNIADILTLEKYYETYPNKRPTLTNTSKNYTGIGYSGIIKMAEGTALSGMVRGLKKYISENNPPEEAPSRELLKIALLKL